MILAMILAMPEIQQRAEQSKAAGDRVKKRRADREAPPVRRPRLIQSRRPVSTNSNEETTEPPGLRPLVDFAPSSAAASGSVTTPPAVLGPRPAARRPTEPPGDLIPYKTL